MEKKPEVLEYKKCPVCGSEETVIASLAAEEVAKGINPTAVPHYLSGFQFVMRNPQSPIIIGGRIPGGNVFMDVCKGCGIIRAVRIEIGEALALAKPPKG